MSTEAMLPTMRSKDKAPVRQKHWQDLLSRDIVDPWCAPHYQALLVQPLQPILRPCLPLDKPPSLTMLVVLPFLVRLDLV